LIQIVTETGLRIYKELAPIRKEHLDLLNGTVWIPDSKTVNGVAEVPLTDIAIDAFRLGEHPKPAIDDHLKTGHI
jgi:integrase